MPKYRVSIYETLGTGIDVEADSLEEAEEKVSDMYHNGEIILYPEDYIETQFKTCLKGSMSNEQV